MSGQVSISSSGCRAASLAFLPLPLHLQSQQMARSSCLCGGGERLQSSYVAAQKVLHWVSVKWQGGTAEIMHSVKCSVSICRYGGRSEPYWWQWIQDRESRSGRSLPDFHLCHWLWNQPHQGPHRVWSIAGGPFFLASLLVTNLFEHLTWSDGGLQADKRKSVKLFYGTHDPESTAYREAFADWEAAGIQIMSVFSADGTGYVQDVFEKVWTLGAYPPACKCVSLMH